MGVGRGGVDELETERERELGKELGKEFGETELGKPEANTPQQPDSGLSGRRWGALSSGLGEWGGRAEVGRTS